MGGKSHHTFDTFLPKVSERSQNLQTPFQAPFLSFLSSLLLRPVPPSSLLQPDKRGGRRRRRRREYDLENAIAEGRRRR